MAEEIITIPDSLDKWNIAVLDSLIKFQYLESDTLDFKEDMGDIEKDICGMANSSGGFIVIGIRGKDKAEQKKPIPSSNEHELIQRLNGKLSLIDPAPRVDTNKITEGANFYLILKITQIQHLKPFNLKSNGGFYIRLSGATQPASRTIILNLFSDNLGRRQRLTVLKNTVEILIKELSLRKMNGSLWINKDYIQNIAGIDLSFIKSSIVNAGDLIFDLDESGSVKDLSYTSGLLTTIIPKLEEFNVNMNGFNETEIGSAERQTFANWVSEFGRSQVPTLLDGLNKFKNALDKMLNS